MRLKRGPPSRDGFSRLFKTKELRPPAEALARFGEDLTTALAEADVQKVAVGGHLRNEKLPNRRPATVGDRSLLEALG